MKFRPAAYFLSLSNTLGFRAAVRFSLAFSWYKLSKTKHELVIPIGPYLFCVDSLEQLSGPFMEIFINKSYRLTKTQNQIQVVDCGANIGLSVLYFKCQAPHARIVCFEPNPSARKLLDKNVRLNGWESDVVVHPVALGAEKKVADFFVEKDFAASMSGSLVKQLASKRQALSSYSVNVEPLSSYIIDTIDVLKIDVEGSEEAIIKELIKTYKIGQVKEIQLEYHFHPALASLPVSHLCNLLESSGFSAESHKSPGFYRASGLQTYMVYAKRP